MTTPHHYQSNLRDLNFNLFEWLDIKSSSLGKAPYGDWDEATARDVLREMERFCTNEFASSFVESDRVSLKLGDDGSVKLPKGMTRSLQAFYEADWHRLGLPEHVGGMGTPRALFWACFEMMVGANPAAAFYAFGTFCAQIIDELGTESQKSRFVKNIVERKWACTMVLTEPDAGSDVGAGRTKARHVEGEIWEIEGVKRFITAGEFDTPENIVHMVLARREGGETGTKGLSMFIVPKLWVNEDGSLGEPNGVRCTNLEDKMGLKGSATCEMTFGEDRPARGFLVGDVHEGIRQMFHIIEQARMAVGTKSASTLSSAYFNALEYAKERIQGPDLLNIMDKSSPRVSILRHPDVRRMLMQQKAHAEAMRGMILYTAYVQDKMYMAGGPRSEKGRSWARRNDLLLPLVKGYCSERVFELLSLSLQCFGGSGYVKDYPIEQYIRDQKIDTLYEGTTHIQALDLFLRKIARDGGETLRSFMGEIQGLAESQRGGEALAEERAALARGVADVGSIFMTMMGKVPESLYHVGLQGNRILFALSELVMGWCLVEQAAIAVEKRAVATDSDRIFYESKIATTRFYCREVLPRLTLVRKQVEKSELSLMEMDDALF